MNNLLAICRPGFEKECIAALAAACAERGVSGFGRAEPDSGYARWQLQGGNAVALAGVIGLDELVFARDLFACGDPVPVAPPDRLAGVRPLLPGLPALDSVALAAPDTNEGRELATLLGKLQKPLEAACREAGVKFQRGARGRFLLFLTHGGEAIPCLGDTRQAPPWPLGVPRLRLLREAPSRSALKLEEAWHLFIPREDWPERLRPGMLAVDLGAAPGGWTWQLVRRGMKVEAVDNGPLAPTLRDDPQVTHHRADGFTFRPRRPVDWLVCDMVEKPARVTALIGQWLVRRQCRQAIFNLKLPMKNRYGEARLNLDRLATELREAGYTFELRARQLYHDREEITVYVRVTGRVQAE